MTTRETIESVASYETEKHTYDHWVASGGPAADRAQRKALVDALNLLVVMPQTPDVARVVRAIDAALGPDGLCVGEWGRHTSKHFGRYTNKRTKHA